MHSQARLFSHGACGPWEVLAITKLGTAGRLLKSSLQAEGGPVECVATAAHVRLDLDTQQSAALHSIAEHSTAVLLLA